MKIEKVDDGGKFPRCPDCDVPLYHESTELGNKQKTEKKRWDECDHEYSHSGGWYCDKCGYSMGISHIPFARLMRCPKCAALYHVEDG